MSGPWDDLEPRRTPEGEGRSRSQPGQGPRTPGGFTVFLRGATRHCPRCGSGRLFSSWFKIRDRCPRCGLRLEREEGGFLGAMTLNYLFTAVVWLVVLVVWLAMDLPDLHVPALTVTSIAIVALVPLLFWPFSKTIWASVDFLIYRTSPDYGSREAADRSSGNGGRH
ncbi:MAG TPA: DUF983 domain-containing protein [Actinomycetota bacterium]